MNCLNRRGIAPLRACLISLSLCVVAAVKAQELRWDRELGSLYRVETKLLKAEYGPDGSVYLLMHNGERPLVAKYDKDLNEKWRMMPLEVRTLRGAAMEVDAAGDVFLGAHDSINSFKVYMLKGGDGSIAWLKSGQTQTGFGPNRPYAYDSALTAKSFWFLSERFDRTTGNFPNIYNAGLGPDSADVMITADDQDKVYTLRTARGGIQVKRAAAESDYEWQQYYKVAVQDQPIDPEIVHAEGKLYAASTVASKTGPNRIWLLAIDTKDGRLLWEKFLDQPGTVTVGSMAMDRAGDLVITGSGTSEGQRSLRTWKLKTDGSPIWQKDVVGGSNASGLTISFDRANDIYIGGFAMAGATQNGMALKYHSNGDLLWKRRMAGTSALREIAVSEGEAFLIGDASDEGPAASTFVAKIDPADGDVTKKEHVQEFASDTSVLMSKVDKNECLYLVQRRRVSDARFAYVISKFSADGTLLWEKTHDQGAGQIHDLNLDEQGNVLVLSTALMPGEKHLGTLAKYVGATGDLTWTRFYGPYDSIRKGSRVLPGKDGEVFTFFSVHDEPTRNSFRPAERLVKTSSDGELKWSVDLKNTDSLVVDREGHVVINQRHVKRISREDGSVLWEAAARGRLIAGPDGLPIVVGPTSVAKLNLADGTSYWSYPGGGPAAIDAVGNLYTTSFADGKTSLSKRSGSTGKELWSREYTGIGPISQLHVGWNDVIAATGAIRDSGPIKTWVATIEGNDGDLLWKKDISVPGHISPSGIVALPRYVLLLAAQNVPHMSSGQVLYGLESTVIRK